MTPQDINIIRTNLRALLVVSQPFNPLPHSQLWNSLAEEKYGKSLQIKLSFYERLWAVPHCIKCLQKVHAVVTSKCVSMWDRGFFWVQSFNHWPPPGWSGKASGAGGYGIYPLPRHTKDLKMAVMTLFPECLVLWGKHYHWPAGVRMNWMDVPRKTHDITGQLWKAV